MSDLRTCAETLLDGENLQLFDSFLERLSTAHKDTYLWVWYGTGANGKSYLLNKLQEHPTDHLIIVPEYKNSRTLSIIKSTQNADILVVCNELSWITAELKQYVKVRIINFTHKFP